MASRSCGRSPELVALIVSHMEWPNLAPYSTISHEWRWAIESHTFATFEIEVANLDDFARIVTSHRRRIVKSILFHIKLAPYDPRFHHIYETPADQAKNNQRFTSAIRQLFNCLSSWRRDGTSPGHFELRIMPQSPTDFISEAPALILPNRSRADISTRFDRSYLQYITPSTRAGQSLPMVPVITHLSIYSTDEHKHFHRVSPASATLIISKLPSLQNVALHLFDGPGDPDLRKRVFDGKYSIFRQTDKIILKLSA